MYRGSTGKWAVECKLGKSKHIVGGKGNTSAFVQLWNSYKTSDIFLVAAGKKIPCVYMCWILLLANVLLVASETLKQGFMRRWRFWWRCRNLHRCRFWKSVNLSIFCYQRILKRLLNVRKGGLISIYLVKAFVNPTIEILYWGILCVAAKLLKFYYTDFDFVVLASIPYKLTQFQWYVQHWAQHT